MSDVRYQPLAIALAELVEHMRSQHLWSDEKPDANALASMEPFCVDTLNFEQWLQYVMVPTFMSMIESEQVLPNQCDIHPMAQQAWQQKYQVVQGAIKVIDRVISTGE